MKSHTHEHAIDVYLSTSLFVYLCALFVFMIFVFISFCLYRLSMKLREGNVFTGVSVGGGGM